MCGSKKPSSRCPNERNKRHVSWKEILMDKNAIKKERTKKRKRVRDASVVAARSDKKKKRQRVTSDAGQNKNQIRRSKRARKK